MSAQTHKLETHEINELRKQAGKWLKEARDTAGLSQRELAAAVGIEYYTFISQLESGRGRVPADRYAAFAKALHIEPREFAITMMKYNDPITYNLVFGDQPVVKEPTTVERLEERLRRLEAIMK